MKLEDGLAIYEQLDPNFWQFTKELESKAGEIWQSSVCGSRSNAGIEAIEAFFINYHPERSHSVREANGMAESKDPYTACSVRSDARHSSSVVRRPECLAAGIGTPAVQGSFDSARVSRREALAALRMTAVGGMQDCRFSTPFGMTMLMRVIYMSVR
jgi:hypothetical protein